MPTPLRSIYQLKVTLKGIKPPIWRRLLVSNSMTLNDLHLAIQFSIGWTNSHLYDFEYQGKRYSEPSDEDDFYDLGEFVKLDSTETRLSSLLRQEKEKLSYTYDFGDNWQHEVLLEKILPFKTDLRLPSCLKGRRSCPPEDIGGPYGYKRFLEIFNNPKHPEHEEHKEWVEDDFDSENIDLDGINLMLADIFD